MEPDWLASPTQPSGNGSIASAIDEVSAASHVD
jgi:hypothetical protein